MKYILFVFLLLILIGCNKSEKTIVDEFKVQTAVNTSAAFIDGWQEASFIKVDRRQVAPWQNTIIDSIDVENDAIVLSGFVRENGLDRQFYKRQMSGDLTDYLKPGDTITLRNLWQYIDRTSAKDFLFQSEQNGEKFSIKDVVFDSLKGRTTLTIDGDLFVIPKQGVRAKNERTGQNEGIKFLDRSGFLYMGRNWGNKAREGDTIRIYGDAYGDGFKTTIQAIESISERRGTGYNWFCKLSDLVPYEVVSYPDKCYPVIQYDARSNGSDVLYDLMIPDGQIESLILYWEGGSSEVVGRNEYNRQIFDTTFFKNSYVEPEFGSILVEFKEPPPPGRFRLDYSTTKISGPDNRPFIQYLLETENVVTVPAGHYLSSGGIFIPDDRILKGEAGSVSFLYQKPGPESISKSFISTANDTTRNTRFNKMTRNVTIKDLTIIGPLSYPDKENLNMTIQSGSRVLNIQYSERIRVENVRIESAGFDCFYAGGQGYNSNDVAVIDCHFLNAGRNNLTATGCELIRVDGCLIEQDGVAYVGIQQQDYGIRSAFGAKNVDFETNGTGDRFDLRFTNNVVQFSNYGAFGISPRKGGYVSRGVVIKGNLFYFNQDLHIRFGTGESENSVVIGNVFRGGRLGIDVNGHNVINIQGNTFDCVSALRIATVNKQSYGMIVGFNSFTPSTQYGLNPPGQSPELYEENLIIHNADEIESY